MESARTEGTETKAINSKNTNSANTNSANINSESVKNGKLTGGATQIIEKEIELKGMSNKNTGLVNMDANPMNAGHMKVNTVKNTKTIRDTASTVTIVKRNGMLVPFRKERIASAVEKAFREIKEISSRTPLPQDVYAAVQDITFEVVEEVKRKAISGESINVEGIQDIVEIKIMENGHYEVAKGYIIYRDERKELRDGSPQNMKVLRRDGKSLVRFNPMKIAGAIELAFRASLKIQGSTPDDVIDAVNLLTSKVVIQCVQLNKDGAQLGVEKIQDEVERIMMMEGHFQVAKDFIIYRAKRSDARSQREDLPEVQILETRIELLEQQQLPIDLSIVDTGAVFSATAKDGSQIKVTEREIRERIQFACKGLEGRVNPEEIVEESLGNFYQGIRIDEIDTSSILAARSKIEKEPAYSNVAARLLLDVIYRETIGVGVADPQVEAKQAQYFSEYLKNGVAAKRLSPDLLKFDEHKITKALKLNRDLKFDYLGLQTLYDRYLIHDNDIRIESPQIFWMRVAMGLVINEGKDKGSMSKEDRAIEFYNVLSQFEFVSSTPTLFNSGTLHSQMSSCYLTTVSDDLKHIFKCVSDDAQLSKWAGGLGNDWTNVRATGARIQGTNGRSQGVIPFLKVANDTAVAVNQGGKRKGAMCAYLETWHLDIEDFLELRKNTGDERRRTHDMNTANWIPDLFMKRVIAQGNWTLFSPNDVPELHDLYGRAFETKYAEYEQKAEKGEIKNFKKVEAILLWRKMLSMLFETGHPWITFKDPSNIRSPQDHVGVVHSSNLCTEILLNTSEDETAVCNLGSVNMVAHVTDKGLDLAKLEKTIRTAVRMLDNVIDINFYPTQEAKNANMRHRPIGLGIMGFQDALYLQKLSYASPEAVKFADESMEAISYYAILASSELAKERGVYESYKGSKWDRGMLPIDTIKLLAEERGAEYVEVDTSAKLDWSRVRESLKKHGMRNSNTMAIAPTATISNITSVTQSIEPMYKHLFAKSNLSGEFIIHNEYLVADLKKLNMWDHDMIDDLKYFDGSIQEIERIPEWLKTVYLTAFEIEPEWLIECASRRQKWIDMGQSLNLYMAEASGKKLDEMYKRAWKSGLKTTYYLRSMGATQIEKSTTDINRRGLQPRWMKNKSASSNVILERGDASVQTEETVVVKTKTVETTETTVTSAVNVPKACNLDGDCESCQ